VARAKFALALAKRPKPKPQWIISEAEMVKGGPSGAAFFVHPTAHDRQASFGPARSGFVFDS
jgi:hypothetical protein